MKWSQTEGVQCVAHVKYMHLVLLTAVCLDIIACSLEARHICQPHRHRVELRR